MRTLIATLIALMLFATTPVVAGDLDDGRAAYRAGDYQKAFQLFEPLAEQGDVRAQTLLGVMYFKGKGVPEDYAKAVHWYTKAAKQGLTAAQGTLGLMYHAGFGVPQDHAKAVHWYTKAAKQGDVGAQFALSGKYYNGEGVPENYVHAYAWVSIAAARGDADGKKIKKLIVKFMSTAQIADGQKLSGELWEKYIVPFQ